MLLNAQPAYFSEDFDQDEQAVQVFLLPLLEEAGSSPIFWNLLGPPGVLGDYYFYHLHYK